MRHERRRHRTALMLYDLMQRDDDRVARAVNKGLWGDKNG